MYEILIRFHRVIDNTIIEAKLDYRLSFLENFKLLESICEINLSNSLVYDNYRKQFLNMNTKLEEFNINSFIELVLF